MDQHSILSEVLRQAKIPAEDGLAEHRALNILRYVIGRRGLDNLRPLVEDLREQLLSHSGRFISVLEEAVIDAA